ncbi:MAG: hypothetical protein HQ546_02780 [Planctomycetes bacterium]|nr:hypothetical protein [Planctomycetota bacterium]
MQFLATYLEQIRRMIAGLTTAAKLAVGLLVVLTAVTLWMLIAYAGRPEMVSVFEEPLSSEQLGQAKHCLTRQNIPVSINNGLLMVPADRRDEAFSVLAYENVMPADRVSAFEDLARNESMWRTENESSRLWHHAKQAKLSLLVAKMPGVRQAEVILEAGQPKGLGRPAVPATASVHVTLNNGAQMDRKLRTAVADLVSGSVGGMSRANVNIVDATNGLSYHVPEDQQFDSDLLETAASLDAYYTNKIQALLSYIPDVIVCVTATPDPVKSIRSSQVDYKEPVSGQLIASNEESKNAGGQAGGEPGISANTAGALSSSAKYDSSSERSDKAMESRFPETRVETIADGGHLKDIFVSVNVPREYLIQDVIGKLRDVDEVPPSDDELQYQTNKIRDSVAIGIGQDSSKVKVTWYVAGSPVAAAAPVQAGVSGYLGDKAKPAVLGGLALMALLMVLMFARRRPPVQEVAEAQLSAKEAVENAVGVIEGEDAALEGLELNDETIRTQRIVSQLSELVKGNPDAASNLIRRWITAK